jgi:hypothetical protein
MEMFNFTQYYDPSELSHIVPRSPQYNLPIKTDQISNFYKFSEVISLTNNSVNLLEKNGFVIIENTLNPKEEDIVKPYATLRSLGIPIFITSDSLLHIYHIQFDETLKNIEERQFYHELLDISKELLNDLIIDYYNATNDNDLKEALKLNAAYFVVGLSLLKPTIDHLCTANYRLIITRTLIIHTSKKAMIYKNALQSYSH